MGKPVGTATLDPSAGSHLCVLVHGLWGNPDHFAYLASALHTQHPELQVLVTKRNAGRNTYDGIETCGERVAWEIEDALQESAARGVPVTRISVVGYSLGGLIARYAIGLLYSKGHFDTIQPVNFTTFATPHLGVRSPLRGFHHHIWNVLGARTLSASGRQLFTIDNFRGTGRPLLSALADRESAFYKGLQLFAHKTLYANVVNDRSTVFHTSAISRCNPYEDAASIAVANLNFVPGYAPVVIDPDRPRAQPSSSLPSGQCQQSMMQRVGTVGKKLVLLPWVLVCSLAVCVATLFYLINAVLQNALSMRRIRMHCTQELGRGYRALPLLLVAANATDRALEGISHSMPPQHMSAPRDGGSGMVGQQQQQQEEEEEEEEEVQQEERQEDRGTRFPNTLALTQAQFEMIDALDSLRFRKFSVRIARTQRAHAAIIVRKPEKWCEGALVVAHWVREVFVI